MLSFGGVATIGAFGEASSERFDKSSEVIRNVAHQDESYAPRTPVITRQFRLDGWGRTRMVVSTSKGDFAVWPEADLSLPSESNTSRCLSPTTFRLKTNPCEICMLRLVV